MIKGHGHPQTLVGQVLHSEELRRFLDVVLYWRMVATRIEELKEIVPCTLHISAIISAMGMASYLPGARFLVVLLPNWSWYVQKNWVHCPAVALLKPGPHTTTSRAHTHV
jgi:hypothetical protein